jgi:hypothetical protein
MVLLGAYAYRNIGYSETNGIVERRIVSSGQMTLVKVNGMYVPGKLDFSDDSLEIEYMFDFQSTDRGYQMDDWNIKSISAEFGGGRTPKQVPIGVNLRQGLIR